MGACHSWPSRSMFSKIVVALNLLPESQRALHAAIEIAASFEASLATVSVLGELPAYTSFAIVADPNAADAMRDVQRTLHNDLHDKAAELAHERGLQIHSAIVEDRNVEAVLHYLREEKAELLVLGLHQHDFHL